LSGSPPDGGALVGLILEGKAPENLRAAAAKGALPLSRTELARLFVALLEDPVQQIRVEAQASLQGMTDDAVREVLGDRACAPEVLNHFSSGALKDESFAERIVFHPALPDEALDLLSTRGNSKIIELVMTNQELLLTRPALLDRLSGNPALQADQRGRLLELIERAVTAMTPDEHAGDGDGDGMTAEDAAKILSVDVGELFAASEIMGGEEIEESGDPNLQSAYKKILTLNTGQKAILAMKGGREERMILVRDTNKVVSLAVLKNPRINEGDIEHISLMRNVSDDVLRTIGQSREWAKSYKIIRSLVHNPRTPSGVAMNFVGRLHNSDLKNLRRDRNVPEIIRRMAKRVYDTRTQKRTTVGRKH
jgi:hypothetical protein